MTQFSVKNLKDATKLLKHMETSFERDVAYYVLDTLIVLDKPRNWCQEYFDSSFEVPSWEYETV